MCASGGADAAAVQRLGNAAIGGDATPLQVVDNR